MISRKKKKKKEEEKRRRPILVQLGGRKREEGVYDVCVLGVCRMVWKGGRYDDGEQNRI
jgi:hypothetical protein